jgi:hypothetical protein
MRYLIVAETYRDLGVGQPTGAERAAGCAGGADPTWLLTEWSKAFTRWCFSAGEWARRA